MVFLPELPQQLGLGLQEYATMTAPAKLENQPFKVGDDGMKKIPYLLKHAF